MAKYYYDVYKINYSQIAPVLGRTSGRYSFNENPLGGTLTAEYDYYPSIGFHINEGYHGVGTKVTKSRGDYPPIGYYAIDSGNAYKMLSTMHEVKYNDYDFYNRGVGRKGDYVETIIAEDGTYPSNGRKDGLWYVRMALVFPELKARINGVLKTSEMGWVRVGGQLREIETIWVRTNGAIKEVQ